MRLVLIPLKDDYKYVTLRTTQLESFLNPPEYIQTNEEVQNRTFDIGHAMWTTIQCYWMNPSTLHTNLMVYKQVLWEFEWLENLWQVELEWDMQWKFGDIRFVSCSNKYTLEIEFGDYLFHINGESDVLWVYDNKLFMWDIKSAWARRKGLDKKIQCMMYPLMLEQLVEEWSIKDFFYFIFLKNKKKWVCQVLRYPYDRKEALKNLTYFLSRYINENKRNSSKDTRWSDVNTIVWPFHWVLGWESDEG